jgi:hypothetical protein
MVDVNARPAFLHKQPGALYRQQQNRRLFLWSDWLFSQRTIFHLDFMHTRSDPIETAGADRNAADSRERSSDAAAGPPVRAHQRHAAHQAAAAAEFERLKARLRQLVGTNKTMR